MVRNQLSNRVDFSIPSLIIVELACDLIINVEGCRAVALAPIVDRGLSWFTVKFKFESQGKVRHSKLLWVIHEWKINDDE